MVPLVGEGRRGTQVSATTLVQIYFLHSVLGSLVLNILFHTILNVWNPSWKFPNEKKIARLEIKRKKTWIKLHVYGHWHFYPWSVFFFNVFNIYLCIYLHFWLSLLLIFWWHFVVILFLFIYLSLGCATCGILVPWAGGSNPCSLHWELRVITTGPPGKSLISSI